MSGLISIHNMCKICGIGLGTAEYIQLCILVSRVHVLQYTNCFEGSIHLEHATKLVSIFTKEKKKESAPPIWELTRFASQLQISFQITDSHTYTNILHRYIYVTKIRDIWQFFSEFIRLDVLVKNTVFHICNVPGSIIRSHGQQEEAYDYIIKSKTINRLSWTIWFCKELEIILSCYSAWVNNRFFVSDLMLGHRRVADGFGSPQGPFGHYPAPSGSH